MIGWRKIGEAGSQRRAGQGAIGNRRGFGGEDRARSAGESALAGDRFEKATQRAPCESQNSPPTADANANESTMDSGSLKNGQSQLCLQSLSQCR